MIAPMHVAVLLGGPSAEREVSLRSGAAVAAALRTLGHAVDEIDPIDPAWQVPDDTEVVFLALHGTFGEDGGVQRILEARGLPYTGCDAESSRIAFDKVLTKQRCLKAGIPTAPYRVVDSVAAPWPSPWEPPLVVKPVRQGSSVGLRFVDRLEDWRPALEECLRYDREALIEPRILGRELTVGILEGESLPVVEVRPRLGIYDFQHKYTRGATEYLCPAPLEPSIHAAVKAAALGAFSAVGGRDYARIDVMLTAEGAPMVLEVNTLPGMTETSLLPKAAAAAGLSYTQLCQRMIELAWRRHRARKPFEKGASEGGQASSIRNDTDHHHLS
jgi:D-alanine-D-alanine ligase